LEFHAVGVLYSDLFSQTNIFSEYPLSCYNALRYACAFKSARSIAYLHVPQCSFISIFAKSCFPAILVQNFSYFFFFCIYFTLFLYFDTIIPFST
jgi:hypothetical protein